MRLEPDPTRVDSGLRVGPSDLWTCEAESAPNRHGVIGRAESVRAGTIELGAKELEWGCGVPYIQLSVSRGNSRTEKNGVACNGHHIDIFWSWLRRRLARLLKHFGGKKVTGTKPKCVSNPVPFTFAQLHRACVGVVLPDYISLMFGHLQLRRRHPTARLPRLRSAPHAGEPAPAPAVSPSDEPSCRGSVVSRGMGCSSFLGIRTPQNPTMDFGVPFGFPYQPGWCPQKITTNIGKPQNRLLRCFPFEPPAKGHPKKTQQHSPKKKALFCPGRGRCGGEVPQLR